MHKSELIDDVRTTTLIDDARDAMLATAIEGTTISLLGYGSCMPIIRAAWEVRDPRFGAQVQARASRGARAVLGCSYAAALNAKSGARKAASAPGGTTTKPWGLR